MNKQTFNSYPTHWVTSDVHLNHRNIPQYCPDSRGQFVSYTGADESGEPIYTPLLDEMNETIISNWNSKVGSKDHVFIIGDVAMGKISDAQSLIRRLNGHKTLIRGNHDRSLCKQPWVNELFINIVDYLMVSVNGVDVVMSHFPFSKWENQARGSIALHGHLHSPCDKVFTSPGNRTMDIGLDGNGLFPRSLADVVSTLSAIPMPTHDHHGDLIGDKLG